MYFKGFPDEAWEWSEEFVNKLEFSGITEELASGTNTNVKQWNKNCRLILACYKLVVKKEGW